MYKSLEGVILDWAGTTVDYGCFAPVAVFINIFSEIGIEVTFEEAREPMGMLKWDHIKAMLSMDRINNLWIDKFDRHWTDEDVDVLYKRFEPKLMATLDQFSRPINSVVKMSQNLKKEGIKIGSTTGYTDRMIEVVAENAKLFGYEPHAIVTPDATNKVGRPMPYMIFENMKRLSLSAPWKVVKVGDTLMDIKEGINAGVWSVGVLVGSSQIGMSESEFIALSAEEKELLVEKARKAFYNVGAHFTIETMAELESLLKVIDDKVSLGDRPNATK